MCKLVYLQRSKGQIQRGTLTTHLISRSTQGGVTDTKATN